MLIVCIFDKLSGCKDTSFYRNKVRFSFLTIIYVTLQIRSEK